MFNPTPGVQIHTHTHKHTHTHTHLPPTKPLWPETMTAVSAILFVNCQAPVDVLLVSVGGVALVLSDITPLLLGLLGMWRTPPPPPCPHPFGASFWRGRLPPRLECVAKVGSSAVPLRSAMQRKSTNTISFITSSGTQSVCVCVCVCVACRGY